MFDHEKYNVKVGQIYHRADGALGDYEVLNVDLRAAQGDVTIKNSLTQEVVWIDCFKLTMVRYNLVKDV